MTNEIRRGSFQKSNLSKIKEEKVALTEIKNSTDNSNFGIVTEFIRKEESNVDLFTINYISIK